MSTVVLFCFIQKPWCQKLLFCPFFRMSRILIVPFSGLVPFRFIDSYQSSVDHYSLKIMLKFVFCSVNSSCHLGFSFPFGGGRWKGWNLETLTLLINVHTHQGNLLLHVYIVEINQMTPKIVFCRLFPEFKDSSPSLLQNNFSLIMNIVS